MLNTLFSRLLIHRNIYLAILILGELPYAFKFESCFAYSPLNIPEYNYASFEINLDKFIISRLKKNNKNIVIYDCKKIKLLYNDSNQALVFLYFIYFILRREKHEKELFKESYYYL